MDKKSGWVELEKLFVSKTGQGIIMCPTRCDIRKNWLNGIIKSETYMNQSCF